MISLFKYFQNTIVFNKGLGNVSIINHIKIYRQWEKQLKSKMSPFDLKFPWITVAAKNYLDQYLKDNSNRNFNVFEYGSGGSTMYFLNFSEKVVSVEHDEKWYEYVKKSIFENQLEKKWEGFFIQPEIDPSMEKESHPNFANPLQYLSQDLCFRNYNFRKYVELIEKYPDDYFDIVLVDGRSRPSCLKHSIPKIKSGGLLILDNAERDYYLESDLIPFNKVKLVFSLYGVLVSYELFTKTNIYVKR